MKKIFKFGAVIIALGLVLSQTTPYLLYAGGPDIADYKTLTTGVTNIAASTTNTTAGGTFEMYHAPYITRIWMSAIGGSAGSPLTGSLIARFQTSFDSNTWDTASSASIFLSMSNSMAGATNCVSDWFQTGGARYLRVGQIENTYAGAISNITITVGVPNSN